MQFSMHVTRRPRLSARQRATRLGLAAFLGLLVAAPLTGVILFGLIPPNSPLWLRVAPLFGAAFLPPALSLLLDAPVRRSWRVLLVALVALALLILGIPLVNSLFAVSIAPISQGNYAVGSVLLVAYILSVPLLIAAAAAFTIGGLGGYAGSWALTAMGAGVLAWAAIDGGVLAVADMWSYLLDPCNVPTLCYRDALYSLLVLAVVGGLIVAPLGGLLGGGLRAWVGRMAQAS